MLSELSWQLDVRPLERSSVRVFHVGHVAIVESLMFDARLRFLIWQRQQPNVGTAASQYAANINSSRPHCFPFPNPANQVLRRHCLMMPLVRSRSLPMDPLRMSPVDSIFSKCRYGAYYDNAWRLSQSSLLPFSPSSCSAFSFLPVLALHLFSHPVAR